MMRTRSFSVRLVALSGTVLFAAGLLAGCGSDWWAPPPAAVDNSVGLESGSSDDFAEDTETALRASVTDLPSMWNAVAKANDSQVVLPDPIVADDDAAGTSDATLVIGDYTLILQWSTDTDELSFAELDGPISGDLPTSDFAIVGESLIAGTLGLSAADSKKFITDVIAGSEADPTDPTSISGSAPSGDSTVTLDVSADQGSWIVSPGV